MSREKRSRVKITLILGEIILLYRCTIMNGRGKGGVSLIPH